MPESRKLPSDVVAQRIAELRNARDPAMSQTQLADRLTALGFKYDQTAVSKLEKGRRPISVDILFALAFALDASPLALLVPLDESRVVIGEGKEVTPDDLRLWVRGIHLRGTDIARYLESTYGMEIPEEALERARTEALTAKRERLAQELEQLDRQIEGES
jgi:transcriptional regulator with XRE-family HTH domain